MATKTGKPATQILKRITEVCEQTLSNYERRQIAIIKIIKNNIKP